MLSERLREKRDRTRSKAIRLLTYHLDKGDTCGYTYSSDAEDIVDYIMMAAKAEVELMLKEKGLINE